MSRITITAPPNDDAIDVDMKTPIEPPHKDFCYPACWADKERMQVLLAPFRERSVNAEGYDAKMKFWQKLIVSYCEHKGEAIFTKPELQMVFTRSNQTPQCLTAVLADMQSKKQIRARIEYEYDPMNTWFGWLITSFVKRPIAKLKSTVTSIDQSLADQYVHLELHKRFTDELDRQVFKTLRGRVLQYETIAEIARYKLSFTENCLRLCLYTLTCQLRIGVNYKERNKQRCIHLIKIPAENDGSVEITISELALHDLRVAESALLKQVNGLEIEINSIEKQARQLLSQNKRNMAKIYIRKRQLMLKQHEKHSLALHNIEVLLASVVDAKNNGEILDAYKIGSSALKEVLSSSGLQYDNVDDIIFDMKSTLEAHQEVQNALASANVSETLNNTEYDDDELERELSEFVNECKAGNMSRRKSSLTNLADISKAAGAEVEPPKIVNTDDALIKLLDNLEVDQKLNELSLADFDNILRE